MLRSVSALLLSVAFVSQASAQAVNLTEKAAPGDRARCTLELDLKGNLYVAQGKEKQPLAIEAKARHIFSERVLAVADGLPSTTARFYGEAALSAVVAGEKSDRRLPPEHRTIIARRAADGLLCFSLAGPLTRDELDLVTEHFNPQCLPGLLPGKDVNAGDTWTISNTAAQAACLFDAIIKSQLTGKLTAVKDGLATFTIEGTAEGIENGARATLEVSATGTFDTALGRITALTWKQKDKREQGAVNPESRVEATVTLKREVLAELPKELADAALARVPAGDVPAGLTDIRHTDVKGRYSLVHSRDWHITGETDRNLVMRLLDRGEFAAQATISIWGKTGAGKHVSAADFKKAVADAPGWVPATPVVDAELPTGGGRWLYRVSAKGKVDGVPAAQSFYLLAGPQGDQVVVTVTMKPEKAQAIGTRDAALVNAIEFGKK